MEVAINPSSAAEWSAPILVRESQAGDRTAFDALVTNYLRPALGAAILITGNEADAADAVQEALLLAWRRLHQLRDPLTFPAWFRRIVLNQALLTARRARRISDAMPDLDSRSASLEQELDLRNLRRALDSLDRRDRALLTVHYYWRTPLAETAVMLGLPVGTVKSRVHHATRRLRAAYDAEERR